MSSQTLLRGEQLRSVFKQILPQSRYDKTATSYEAAVRLVSFLIWARSVEDGP